jgi:lysophospholipase L1-like esterase
MRVRLLLVCLLLILPGLGAQAEAPLRILVMGDSMMAVHRISGRAVSHVVSRALGAEVRDQSALGARMIYNLPISGTFGLDIRRQYRAGPWDWIVVNGGGNDLWMGCGCSRCQRQMDKLAADTGTDGEIPKLLMRLRKTGARVLYVGYLRSPGAGSPIEGCRNEGDELERRMGLFADKMPGIYQLSIAAMVPHGDRSHHAADMIHPSIKGSREIGRRIAGVIAQVERTR